MRWAPVVAGAALAALLGWFVHSDGSRRLTGESAASVLPSRAFRCTVAQVRDGTSFTCAERGDDQQRLYVRLAGIGPPAFGEFCARGHRCAVNAGNAAAALGRVTYGQALSCVPNGANYRRVAAFCRRPDGVDLSCAMLAGGYVVRLVRYWEGHPC